LPPRSNPYMRVAGVLHSNLPLTVAALHSSAEGGRWALAPCDHTQGISEAQTCTRIHRCHEYVSLAGFHATTTPLVEYWFWYSESKRAGKTWSWRKLAKFVGR
jgi:hypothetical protein